MDDEQTYKDALLKKRTEILGTGGIKPLQASMENNTRQGDMADQASGNNEVHIQLKLKQTDAKILQAIEEALDADRQGHLRDLPRLRRADRRSATERRSRGRASASSARKSRTRDGSAAAASGILSRQAVRGSSAHRGRASRQRLRRQQHVSVHHQSRGDTALLGGAGDCRARLARCRRPARIERAIGRRAEMRAVIERGCARGTGVCRSLAAPRRGHDQRPASEAC